MLEEFHKIGAEASVSSCCVGGLGVVGHNAIFGGDKNYQYYPLVPGPFDLKNKKKYQSK